ncbi:ABC transporter ATP-binding protein/permease [Rickettsiales bacterium]|nr:ABC transporter ATP-binding protein/permease [Rickettsiales bacterium]
MFGISICASFLEILVHYKIKEIIDIIANKEVNSLSFIIFLFILYKFMHHSMFFIVRLLDIYYSPKLVTQITTDIYHKTVKHSLQWFDSHMSGEISDKINKFQSNFIDIIRHIFRSFVILWTIIIGIIFLFKIHYLTALVQLAFLIIYSPIIYILLKKQLKLNEYFEKSNQQITGIINDSISNIFGIKIIGSLINEFKLKLTPSLLERQKWDKKVRQFDAYFVDMTDTIMIVIMSAVQIYLLSYLYQNNQVSAGSFAFVAMLMLKLHGEVNNILDSILFHINPSIASMKTSYQFVNEKYDIIDSKKAKKIKNIQGDIKFNKVCFAYNNSNQKILDNFNLTIKRGEKIGLVGYSGAGKTTLIKAIIRYFDINSGAIMIDNKNIKDFTQDSLRSHISLIPQDITMFHRSIIDNIQIAKYKANKNEIISACKKAKIHEDIINMKNGYNSIVGERGIKVSGGQRQRIAIARAILKDAPILILDEATSSLDSKTEKMIQESLNLLIKNNSKTVIAIAHRLSTLKNMDRIIVMDKGKIIEIGTHEELLSKENSAYKQLWQLQG